MNKADSSMTMHQEGAIDRKDFCRTAAVAGLGIASIGALSACSDNQSPGEGVSGDVFASIVDTLVRYSTGIDSKDWKLFRGVWADEIDADYGEGIGHWTTGDEITAWMENSHKDMGYTLHRLSNIRITDTQNSEVSTRTYVDAVLYMKDGTLIANAKGFYDDVLTKAGSGYVIRKRVFTSAFQGTSPLDLSVDQALKQSLEKQKIIELQSDYWWYMDTKQWDKWRTVFADDLNYYQFGQLAYESADDFVNNTSELLASTITAHQGHQYKIVFNEDGTASSRFILNDCLSNPDTSLMMRGYGYYVNDYEKIDGQWKIKTMRLGYFRFESGPNGDATVTSEIPYSTSATA
jgi:3-phenylpropionate/cinnamic acid dioxygenase small subunit